MFDVIVVGAGPAGCITAGKLSEAGLEVCLLEKEGIPRDKLCGGGLTPRAYQLLEEENINYSPARHTAARRSRLFHREQQPIEVDLDSSPVHLVDRRRFDQILTEWAVERGTNLHENTAIRDVVQKGNKVGINTVSGQSLSSRFLVGADGFNSRVRADLDFPEQVEGAALTVQLPEDFYSCSDELVFNLDSRVKGYSWIFPGREQLTAGIAGYSIDSSLRKLLVDFIERISGKEVVPGELDFRGGGLPFYRGRESIRRGRVFLAGDAAGLVDSITGEGIYYALWSGRLVAKSIKSHLDSAATDYNLDETEFQDLFDDLRWSKRLADLLHAFPGFCYQFAFRRPLAVSAIKRIISGRSSYSDIFRQFWSKFSGSWDEKIMNLLGLTG